MNEILKLKGITKSFPGVKALDSVDFTLNEGEVHCIAGENGAGKSTLIKILSGAYVKDEGQIFINGSEVEIDNPIRGRELGVNIIYQELELVSNMNIMENLFLGKIPIANKLLGKVNFKEMHSKTKDVLGRVGLEIDPRTKVGDLGVGDQQMVEISKALLGKPKILVMDEPTASLSNEEVKRLFVVIKKLREEGKSIIYISHRMEELWEVGDRITVLREGKKIITESLDEIDEDGVTQAMVGRKLEDKFPKKEVPIKEEIFRVENLSRKGKVKDVSFNLKEGEILGISGLVGAGRTEMARLIFGADSKDTGEVYIRGNKVNIESPQQAINAGLALIPEDRKSHGLVLKGTVKENISLPILKDISNNGVVDSKKNIDLADNYISKLRIKTPNMDQKTKFLSGGNQQKVVLAKWLCAHAKIFFFDEPTRGIDVGAKIEVYQLMTELVEQGAGIVMISSEMPEIFGMSDRILVMHAGEISGEFVDTEECNQQDLLRCALGRQNNE